MVTLIKRLVKGSPRTLEEDDENLTNLDEAIEARTPYQKDGSGNIIGYQGPTGSTFPAVKRPVEVLAASGVPVSCSSTAVDEELYTLNILAGMIGVNSILRIEPLWTFTNSANSKLLKILIGSTTVYSVTRTTSAREAPLIVLASRNALTSQIVPYDSTYVTADAGTPLSLAIDFSVNQTLRIVGQRANAGDSLTLEYFSIQHLIGD
jgi:hypothetical protein